MQISSRDRRNAASDWPYFVTNGYPFTPSLVEKFEGENERVITGVYLIRIFLSVPIL